MGLHMKKQDELFNNKKSEAEDELNQDILTNTNSTIMMSEDQDRSNPFAMSFQQQLERLQQENESLKKEKDSLEIDNVCLEQQNLELKSRIDDFSIQYPKACILLGKKPDNANKNIRLKTLLKRKK